MRLHFERNVPQHHHRAISHQWTDDRRNIYRNVASLNILVHDVINLLDYELWKDKWNIFTYMHYQITLFQLHWSTLTYNRHLKKMIKLIKKIMDPLISKKNLSKVYEKLMYGQMYPFYELFFRRIFETQIHVQTQIRKNFILSLATNDFL